jgi:hypothetical protein
MGIARATGRGRRETKRTPGTVAGEAPAFRFAPRPDISLHLFESGAVLLDRGRQRLYQINASATFIWCCLEEGLDAAEIGAHLARAAGISGPVDSTGIATVLGGWQALGLVGNGLSPPTPTTIASPGRSERHTLALAAATLTCRLLDGIWRMRFATHDLFERVRPGIAHLAAAPGAAAIDLDVMPANAGFVIAEGGVPVERCAALDEVAPMARRALAFLAMRDSQDLCAVHSGALQRDGRCLLLPGRAGSGKSTLCAGLVGAGFDLLGDDTIVLSRGDLAVRPLPLGICVKAGAWPILASRYPKLLELPVHRRLDGQLTRYLTPAEGVACADVAARAHVAWLVFPAYRPDGPTSLIPLEKPAALQALLDEFFPLGAGLDAGAVETLLRWFADVDCYALALSSLAEGVALLDGICR